MAPTDAAWTRSIGLPGIALVLVGAGLARISFAALDWYAGPTRPGAVAHTTFSDLDRLTATGYPGIVSAYFGWLAWAAFLVVIIVGFVANLPKPAANGLRATGLVLGLSGSGLTYYVLDRVARLNDGDYPLHHAQVGVWFALAGFLVAGAGAAIGPMRKRGRPNRSDTIAA
jgi:hypothetical protein